MSVLEQSPVERPVQGAAEPVTVMVLDDRPGARAAMVADLDEPGVRVVASAADAVVIAQLAPPARPQVVVLDADGMSAVEAVHALIATVPNLKVLVLSAGAAPPSMAELVDAVRCSPVVEPPAASAGPRLTGRETEVLRLVATGLTSRQVANRLVLSRRTVENHLQRVMAKLQLHNRVELVRFAITHGLA